MSRALASLGRFPEAHDAFNHTVTPAAEDEFAKAPDDPRSRYYAAEAALQHDDRAAAKKKLDALLANDPSDAPWRQIVADRLAELSQNVGAAAVRARFGPCETSPPHSMDLR
jgi:cytochrome c-type biogenesis protein CcmH